MGSLLRLTCSAALLGCLTACNAENYGGSAAYPQGKAPAFRVHVPQGAPSVNQQFSVGSDAQGNVHEHPGLDFYQPRGTPVLAAADGIVLKSVSGPAYGQQIVIDHGALRTVYKHLSARSAAQGAKVKRGQAIGAVGSTGLLAGGLTHLHFEVHKAQKGRFIAHEPHLFWRGGIGRPTCYKRGLRGAGLTLPLPCKSAP